MTDKELKKLSRLELLEILLEETKENEKLRAEIAILENEKKFLTEEKRLFEITNQMDSALSQVNRLVANLQNITNHTVNEKTSSPQKDTEQHNPNNTRENTDGIDDKTKGAVISDRNLYWRMMKFFAMNEAVLALLPYDIHSDVKTRLRGILDAKK